MTKPRLTTSFAYTPLGIQWDVREIVRLAGGPKRLSLMIAKHNHGIAPTNINIAMWLQRGKHGLMPSRWSAAVVYALEREGILVKEYITDEIYERKAG